MNVTKSKLSRKTPFKTLAKKVNKIASGIELKFHDELGTAGAVAYDANRAQILSDPVQGSTSATRDGREIMPQSLKIRGAIYLNGTSTAPSQTVRIMVVQSKQRFVPVTNTAAIPANNTSVLARQGNTDVCTSDFDINNRRHYTVLYDRTFIVTDYSPTKIFTVNKKLTKKITFENAGSLIGESGQIRLLMFSDVATANNPPVVESYSRMRYTDS